MKCTSFDEKCVYAKIVINRMLKENIKLVIHNFFQNCLCYQIIDLQDDEVFLLTINEIIMNN